MERHFMIDIETTGIDPKKEDLLEVSILELVQRNGYWVPGRSTTFLNGTTRKPESEFAKKHMVQKYEMCNMVAPAPAERIRQVLTDFFKSCGCEGAKDTYLMGWNASNFDIPFLVEKGALVPNYYETVNGKDEMRGDFHYRVYEMGGALSITQNVVNIDRNLLIKAAFNNYPEIEMPEGFKEHDALYDCYRQARILNGLIRILREGYRK